MTRLALKPCSSARRRCHRHIARCDNNIPARLPNAYKTPTGFGSSLGHIFCCTSLWRKGSCVLSVMRTAALFHFAWTQRRRNTFWPCVGGQETDTRIANKDDVSVKSPDVFGGQTANQRNRNSDAKLAFYSIFLPFDSGRKTIQRQIKKKMTRITVTQIWNKSQTHRLMSSTLHKYTHSCVFRIA